MASCRSHCYYYKVMYIFKKSANNLFHLQHVLLPITFFFSFLSFPTKVKCMFKTNFQFIQMFYWSGWFFLFCLESATGMSSSIDRPSKWFSCGNNLKTFLSYVISEDFLRDSQKDSVLGLMKLDDILSRIKKTARSIQ